MEKRDLALDLFKSFKTSVTRKINKPAPTQRSGQPGDPELIGGVLNKLISDEFSIVTDDTMKSEIKRYTIKMIADFLNNQWTMDSYYYDIENHNSSLKPLKQRLADNNLNVNEWLIPIDFHIRGNA